MLKSEEFKLWIWHLGILEMWKGTRFSEFFYLYENFEYVWLSHIRVKELNFVKSYLFLNFLNKFG